MASSPTERELTEFDQNGYLIVRGLFDRRVVSDARAAAQSMLDPLLGPAEFEADVGYPGAPLSRLAQGGLTPRRLLHAYSRCELFRDMATSAAMGHWLRALLGGSPLLSQSHHNCVMTKSPGYSSSTDWHQDIRYWSFERADLISAWIALGTERATNGGLRVLPGSHTLELSDDRYDAARFLRGDVEANAVLIAGAVDVDLEAGDVLFFHCRLFHAAGRNAAEATKLSMVFSYYDDTNRPVRGTRSAQYPALAVRV